MKKYWLLIISAFVMAGAVETEMLVMPQYGAMYAKQLPRFIRLQGGAGSGKSIAIAQKFIANAREPEKRRMFAMRKVARTVKDSVFATFRDLISDYGLTHEFNINRSNYRITHKYTGNEIIMGGMDDSEKFKSVKDPTDIWLEEATEFNRKDFTQANLRLRKAGVSNHLWMAYNPVTRASWIYEDFEEKKLFKGREHFIKTTYVDNYALPWEYREELNRLKLTDEHYHRVYALGEWGEILRGLVFKKFEIVEEFPDDIDPFYGIDFGFVDPMTMVEIGLKGERDIFLNERFFERGVTTNELGNFILNSDIYEGAPMYCDNLPGDIETLNQMGIWGAQKAQKGPGSIISGLRKMLGYNLHITANSVNLLKEFNRYKRKEDKQGNILEDPIDAFNHGIDAARYGITTHLGGFDLPTIIGSYNA